MKKLSKGYYHFLLTELTHHRDQGVITKEQLDHMMSFYEERSTISFIRILVTIGSILIGLGVLSFVASNWAYMGKVLKVILIIGALGASLFTSFKLEEEYPKTSRSLLYLSSLIYGAGIFLMGQIFHYGGEFTGAFLLWTIGMLLMGWILKEEILFVLSHILFLVYMNGSFEENIILYSILLIGIFYLGNKYFDFSNIITFFNSIVTLNFILYFLNYMNTKEIYIALLFFLIGLGMYYIRHHFYMDLFKFQGIVVLGISGLFLTFKEIWEGLPFIRNGNFIAIGFAILLLIYLLSLVRKGLLIPLLFTCALILRYYFDTFYDFMPKSLFFIIGGFILLGFGHYFERLRKSGGGFLNEK